MTKKEEKAETQAQAPAEPTLSLQEFCRRLSETVKHPELIAGFEYSERVAGNTEGTLDKFQAAYSAFVIKPV